MDPHNSVFKMHEMCALKDRLCEGGFYKISATKVDRGNGQIGYVIVSCKN